MLRTLLILLLTPAAGILVWLSTTRPTERADFVVASDALRSIDPHRVSWLDEIQVANALFEGLTRLNPRLFQPEPAAARTWRTNAAKTEYTFELRRDARWSNGEPLIAKHFRFAWLRVLDPKVESQYASLLFVIDGAEPYYRSRLNNDVTDDLPADTVGIRAPDPHTLRVRLAGPCSYFLDLAAFPTLAPVYPPTIERWAYRAGRVLRSTRHLWTRPENIVCNGAFTLERWDFKRRLLLRRNPHYWDAENIAADSIEIAIITNPGTALIGYETGRLDLVRGLDPEVARELHAAVAAGARDDFHVGDRFATFFFRVNCKRAPLDDPRVRQALALAIDRTALCEHVLGLGETPALTFVPRGALRMMPRTDPSGTVTYYDPPAGLGAGADQAARSAHARELLAETPLADPARARPIEIAFASDAPQQRRIAEAIQSMWERDLGIRVELRVMERKVLSAKIRSLDYDLARSDWYGDYLDPATFLDLFVSHSGQNRTGWGNDEYDRLIAAATREGDDRERFALFRAAERILCEQELPIIPVYFKRGNYLLRAGFGGLYDNVRDILPIHRVHLQRQ